MPFASVKHKITHIVMISQLVTVTSCIFEYPDCKEPEGETSLDIHFDRSHIEGDPRGMTALLYPTDGSEYWQYQLPLSGAAVDIDFGSYTAVTFNNDNEAISLRGFKSMNTLEAYTRRAKVTDGLTSDYSGTQPPMARDADLPVVIQPDMMWSDAILDEITIPPRVSIDFTPRPIVAVYNVTVDNVSNTSSIAQCSIAISGLCGNYFLGLARKGDDTVTIPGSLRIASGDAMDGRLLTFGDSPGASCALHVFIWLKNGEKRAYSFDIDSQVKNAPDPMNVTIKAGGIDLPEIDTSDPGPEGGIGVEIDDWESVDIELST